MKRFFISLILLLPLLVQSQTQLTLQTAIDSALKNNLDIQIAKNYVQIAKVENNYGMAGGLPYINANAGDNFSSTSSLQKINTGTETTTNGILGNSVNASLTANIVLFNGFKVMASKKRLSLLQQQSQIELNGQVQDVIASVMIKYYDIIRQTSNMRIMQSVLDVSKKKLDIANEKSNVGMANGVALMQAQSDVNTAEQNLKIQQLIIEQGKADLVQLMNSHTKTNFNINDSIIIDRSLNLDSIMSYLKRNPQLLSAEQQIKINEQMVKEMAAQRYPSLRFNAAYNFGRADNNGGYTLLNQSYGPVAGLTLQVPIFNGGVYRTQKIVAGLNLNNAKLGKDALYNALATSISKQHLAYTTTLQQIESQQTNFELSRKLLDLVMLNFQHGQATILDVKAAEASYESAAYQLINFKYAAKIAEIQLKQMTYQLGY